MRAPVHARGPRARSKPRCARSSRRTSRSRRRCGPREEAIAHFATAGRAASRSRSFEDLEKVGVNEVSSYENGEFLDLCRGPHVQEHGRSARSSCSRSPARTGAATRSNRSCSASTAPRGTTEAELDALPAPRSRRREKRDHRKLGRELDLFSLARGGRRGAHPLAPEARHGAPPDRDTSGRRSTSSAATSSSTRRTSRARSSTRSRATCRTTPTSCTRRWTSTACRTA